MSFWLRPLSVAVVALCAVTAAQAVTPAERQARRVDQRQERQAERIDHGVASGQLTRREAQRLNHQQRHIANMETRIEGDGRVTGKEALRLEHAQDRASRNIHRKKHNARN